MRFRPEAGYTCVGRMQPWKLQEALPPELRQYLKKVSSDPGVQKGVAQALGKRGEAGLESTRPSAAPILPIPGGSSSLHEQVSLSLSQDQLPCQAFL